ncbi:MAG TPA: AAA family ATPase [Lachnospiraceae bacterium]|nr:AAA family ATPase [Lachnospiraceae bacterium]
MGNYLNIGNAGFTAARKGTYVDKTGMISFINSTLGTADKLTCVCRPRRFGKSFAAKMLCAYYDKSCDSRELFEGLEISRDTSFEKYLNKYNVIYLDVTLFISCASDVKDVVRNIKLAVMDEVTRDFPDVPKGASLAETMVNTVKTIGEKFIIIIDEWDALFREAKDDVKLQKEYLFFLRSLFKSSWTDMIFEAAYITGILPIKKYNTQSAMTDFREYTMLAPRKLAEYVGFTEPEVRNLCARHDMDFEEVRRWYDGYSFNRAKSIYSPNSVIEAVKNGELGNYWTQSETYESLKVYIEMDEDGLKEAIVQMLGGAKVRIDTATFQNDMTTMKSRDDVLTLLIHLGYLAYNAGEKSVYIPNEEIHEEFIRAVTTGRHTELAKLIRSSDLLLEATLNMDEEAVAAAIEEAHKAGTAPTFYNNEQALRSVIRVAYISCMEEYLKIDELPSGHGYADVVFFPRKTSSKPLLLVELKWNKTEAGAIRQIKNKDYPQALKGYGGDMLLVGINYDVKSKKHTCRIEALHDAI